MACRVFIGPYEIGNERLTRNCLRTRAREAGGQNRIQHLAGKRIYHSEALISVMYAGARNVILQTRLA